MANDLDSVKYIFVGLFVAAGAAFVLAGIPLARRSVKPNRTYGLRTPKTLESEELWYAANRTTGFGLIASGVVVALASILLEGSHALTYICELTALILASVVATIVAAWYKNLRGV